MYLSPSLQFKYFSPSLHKRMKPTFESSDLAWTLTSLESKAMRINNIKSSSIKIVLHHQTLSVSRRGLFWFIPEQLLRIASFQRRKKLSDGIVPTSAYKRTREPHAFFQDHQQQKKELLPSLIEMQLVDVCTVTRIRLLGSLSFLQLLPKRKWNRREISLHVAGFWICWWLSLKGKIHHVEYYKYCSHGVSDWEADFLISYLKRF